MVHYLRFYKQTNYLNIWLVHYNITKVIQIGHFKTWSLYLLYLFIFIREHIDLEDSLEHAQTRIS